MMLPGEALYNALAEMNDAEAAPEVLIAAIDGAKLALAEIGEICWDKRDPEAAKIACVNAAELACEAGEKLTAAIAAYRAII